MQALLFSFSFFGVNSRCPFLVVVMFLAVEFCVFNSISELDLRAGICGCDFIVFGALNLFL